MRRNGFSLVETLVVLAIIGVMMAIAVPRYVKAIQMAKQVAANEGKRQGHIARLSEGGTASRADPEAAALRASARAAYYQLLDAGKFEFHVTETLYATKNDAEFRAYWHTVIDLDEAVPIEFSGGSLRAKDPEGNVYTLPPQGIDSYAGTSSGAPLMWDFLSTNMGHMDIGNQGITALYPGGSQQYIRYPGAFPCTPEVARLSQRFIDEVLPTL